MSYQNIPESLRQLNRWGAWKFIPREGQKNIKLPINAKTGQAADPTDPDHWCDFETAVNAAVNFSGLAFAFFKADGITGIDLDNTHGDEQARTRQYKICEAFGSYTEISPSGEGAHIIVKGNLPGPGRRRHYVEVYDDGRYFTFTGNVYKALPVEPRQDLLNTLYEEMGGKPVTVAYGVDQPETDTDENIKTAAAQASNGHKFSALFSGDWAGVYPSQSEADFALIDILQHYSKNKAQLQRLYAQSVLGQNPKDNYKHRSDRHAYVNYLIEKSFDKELPPVDCEGWLIQWQKDFANRNLVEASGKPSGKPDASNDAAAAENIGAIAALDVPQDTLRSNFPPGLVGDIAEFLYLAAPRPVLEIALAGAIGFFSGVVGRAYNISGTGLNQYVMVIAGTGKGKEAIASGTSKLMASIKASTPTAADVEGPAEIASSQALIKHLGAHPCCYSIVGEFGIKLKEMSSPHANPNVSGLKRTLLDLYNKSGKNNQLGKMIYSEKDKNTAIVKGPSFTLIGESTPIKFFENITEDIVQDGLLPRFMLVEYNGPRVPLNKAHVGMEAPIDLVETLSSLIVTCITQANNEKVQDVQMTQEAQETFDRFDKWTDALINNDKTGIVGIELWNRAHIKALKYAALVAVGVSPYSPLIDLETANRSIQMIVDQITKLKARFDNGEVGGGSINAEAQEAKQFSFMVRVISEFACKPFEECAKKYRVSDAMYKAKIFPYNSLIMRLNVQVVFKNDRRGAAEAIRRTYQQLIDNDDIREVPKADMQKKFGKSARAFMITHSERFLEIFD
jgi:hypothetical protein